MLHLDAINSKNVWAILKLQVLPSQRGFVAPNDVSIIEAYTTLAAGGQVFPFGVYDDATPVGFVMVGYDTDDSWENPPAIAKGNYNIWRLMIDARYQRRGYGREALRLALDFIRTQPCSSGELHPISAKYCWLSYEPENDIARRLYHAFGFEETGDTDGDEIIARLSL